LRGSLSQAMKTVIVIRTVADRNENRARCGLNVPSQIPSALL
jgi:hypothetical protein